MLQFSILGRNIILTMDGMIKYILNPRPVDYVLKW